MTPRTCDVAVVGGGCMGTSVAYHLTRRGVRGVVIVEREPALGTGSTGRNAGGVRHQFSHEANIRLSIESIRFFERFADEVGAPIDLHQHGYLFLVTRDQDAAAFERDMAVQRRLGVEVEWLMPHAIAEYAPGLRVDGVVGATFCGRDGICDPNGVTMGLAQAARAAGARILRGTEVTGIRVARGRVSAIETSSGVITTGLVVNAAGPWAASIGAMAGVDIPVTPLRRHIFIARPPPAGWARGGPDGRAAGPDTRIMVIDSASTFYFHREGAGLLFGMADPDEPPGFDQSVNWSVLEKIAPVAARWLPALPDLPIAKAWAGLYEMTPDAMPIVGSSGVDGFFTIAGFSGHGFQHAPAAGRILADVIAGSAPGFDMSPFAFDRFAGVGSSGERNVV